MNHCWACPFGGVDNLEHVKQCPGYDTSADQLETDERFGRYLLALHLEHVKRWNQPLIHINNFNVFIYY